MTNHVGEWLFTRLGIHVLWLGDPGSAATRLVEEARALKLSARPMLSGDDIEEIAAAARPRPDIPFDLIVVDATSTDIRASRVLQALHSHDVDLPVVVLVREWHAEVDAAARALACCEYVIKTDGYAPQLLPVFAGAVARAELVRALRRSQEREARLRSAVVDLEAEATRFAERLEAERREADMRIRGFQGQYAAERSAAEALWAAEAARYRELLEQRRTECERLVNALHQAEARYAGCQNQIHRRLAGLVAALGEMERQIQSAGDRLGPPLNPGGFASAP